MREINKEEYKALYTGDRVTCSVCREDIIESNVYINVVKLAREMHQEDDFFEYHDSFNEVANELDDITDIWQGDHLCDHCFDYMNEPNSSYYQKFLDYIFDDKDEAAIRARDMYKDRMSEHLPYLNTGSTKAANLIINALYHKDYYVIKVDGMGEFDLQNFKFIKDTIMKCRGLSVDNLKIGTSLYGYETGYDHSWGVDIDRAKADLKVMQDNIKAYEEISNKRITAKTYMEFKSDKNRFKKDYIRHGARKVMSTIETNSYNLHDLINLIVDNEFPKYTIDDDVIAYAYISNQTTMFKALELKKWAKLANKNPHLLEGLRNEVTELVRDVKAEGSQIDFSDIEKVAFNISRNLNGKETALEKTINDCTYNLIGLKLHYYDDSIEKMEPKINKFQESIANYNNHKKIEIALNVAYKLADFSDMNIGDYESVLGMLKVITGDGFITNGEFGELYGHKIDVDFDECLIKIGDYSIEMEPPK